MVFCHNLRYNKGMEFYLYTILLLLVMVLSFAASARVNSVFQRLNQTPASSGLPAREVARRIMGDNSVTLPITRVSGALTDHYNPKTGTVGLSEAVYDSNSVAALSVAAHEVGHVLQYEEGYAPIRIRNAVLPVANFGCRFGPYLILGGIVLSLFANAGNVGYYIAMGGVALYFVMFLFQLVTLPVESNASRRALTLLTDGGYITEAERPAAKKMLRAAANTYVLAALGSLITILRLLTLVRGTRRSN